MKLISTIAIIISSFILTSFPAAAQISTPEVITINDNGNNIKVIKNRVVVRFKNQVYTQAKANNILSGFATKAARPAFPSKSSLLLNPALTNKTVNNKNNRINSVQLEKIIKAEEPLLRTFFVDYDSEENPIQFCNNIMANSGAIEFAEPCYVNTIVKSQEPNDPYRFEQKLMGTIKVYEAWEIEDGSPDIVIAISDNGIDQRHEDLQKSIDTNYAEIENNGIDDDNNGYIDDYIGYNFASKDDNTPWGTTYINDDHGTETAGIAGATVNNGLGIAGIANKCRIFPIKTADVGSPRTVLYGYESIQYAAIRGFDVINTSWGDVHPFSQYEQSVIDFAVAKGLAIVSSAGNINFGYTELSTYYPAAYKGVLAVGEVDQSDRFTAGSTTLGSYVRIMAPGKGNYTTRRNSDYGKTGGGTSYSSPVVAGALAIVRSKYPELGPVQSQELIRQCTDDIKDKNEFEVGRIPGRINLLKAVTTDPFSIPGISVMDYSFFDKDGDARERYLPGEELSLKIRAKNYLGRAENLEFTLSVALDYTDESISIIDDNVSIVAIESLSEFNIETFKFKINYENRDKVIFRVDIKGQNGYSDFFLLPFIPTNNISTFQNDKIIFSMADNGRFGFNYYPSDDDKDGNGFHLKGRPNYLWKAGIFATEDTSKAALSLNSTFAPLKNDFTVVKPFVKPDRNISIINDDNAFIMNKIGLEITQEVDLPNNKGNYARIKVKVKNITNDTLMNIAVGYKFDWDIISYGENTAELYPKAVPESRKGQSAAAEIIRHTDSAITYGSAIYSAEPNAIAQAAGLEADSLSSTADYVRALSSGTSWQTDITGDVFYVIGMLYPGGLLPGQEKECTVCVAGALNKDQIALDLMQCLDQSVDVEAPSNIFREIKIYPNPSSEYVFVEGISQYRGTLEVSIYDMLGVSQYGKLQFDQLQFDQTSNKFNFQIDISNLPSGVYSLIIKQNDNLKELPFVVIR